MLYLYVIVAFFQTVLSFRFSKKDFLSPTFIVSLFFFIGSLFSLIGNTLYWHEDTSGLALGIISFSLLAMNYGEILGNRLCLRLGVFARENVSLKSAKKIPPLLIWMFFVFGLLINALVFYFECKLLTNSGSPIDKLFLQRVRALFLAGSRLPQYVSFLDIVVQGFGFGSIYLFLFQIACGEPIKKSFFFALPIIPMLISEVLGTSRSGFLVILFFSVALFLLLNGRFGHGVSIEKAFGFILCLFLLFALIFFFLGKITTKINNELSLIDVFCIYGGSSLVAFDKSIALSSPSLVVFSNGYQSFYGLFHLLNKIFPAVPDGIYFSEFIHFSNGDSTNIYTAFRTYYLEFGFLGCLGLSFAIGFLASFIRTFIKKTGSCGYILIFYSFLVYLLVSMLFSPSITADFLSLTFSVHLFSSFVFYLIVRRYLGFVPFFWERNFNF